MLDADTRAKFDQVYADMTNFVELSDTGFQALSKGVKDLAFHIYELQKRVQILEAKLAEKEE